MHPGGGGGLITCNAEAIKLDYEEVIKLFEQLPSDYHCSSEKGRGLC